MSELGEYIKKLRKERRVTQRELAAKVGVDFTYISKIENNQLKNSPSEKAIIEIAKALNADIDKLILMAKKVPKTVRETIAGDPLAAEFLRKVPVMTQEQRQAIKDVIDEV